MTLLKDWLSKKTSTVMPTETPVEQTIKAIKESLSKSGGIIKADGTILLNNPEIQKKYQIQLEGLSPIGGLGWGAVAGLAGQVNNQMGQANSQLVQQANNQFAQSLPIGDYADYLNMADLAIDKKIVDPKPLGKGYYDKAFILKMKATTSTFYPPTSLTPDVPQVVKKEVVLPHVPDYNGRRFRND
jgi:hypothetical protein